MSHLNKNLKHVRTVLGLSQKELADAVCITRSSLANYENDGNEPRYDTLIAICDRLAISVGIMLTRNLTVYDKEAIQTIQRKPTVP